MSEERIDDTGGVDARLRAAFPDDLPPEVARRLGSRVAAEVARRRSRPRGTGLFDLLVPAPLLTPLAIPAALVLLASGALLQETVRPSAARGALARLSVAASASRALGEAGPLLCGTGSPLAGLGPEALAERAFRSWSLVASETVAGGRLRLLYGAGEEGARYELVVDAASFRPRAIRRTGRDAAGAPGHEVDECAWPVDEGRVVPERRPR